MRVLHLIGSLASHHGGPSRAVMHMAQSLIAQGIEIEIASSMESSPGQVLDLVPGELGSYQGVPTRCFRLDTRRFHHSSALLYWLWRNVRRYDLVHVHGLFSSTPTIGALICRARRKPYLLRPLGLLNRYGLDQRRTLKSLSLSFADGWALRQAAAVHFTAAAEEAEASALGFDLRGRVIPLGVDVPPPVAQPESLAATFPFLTGRRVLLYLSRIDRKKNLGALVEAFVSIAPRHPDWVLLVCGDGDSDELARVKALAGASTVVRFAGQVDGERKQAVLASAELYALPSHSENFGIAVVEAMAAATPVVVSRGIPMHQEIADAGAGWICDTEPQALATQLQPLLALPPDVLAAAGRRARALVSARYSVNAMGAALAAAYREILAEQR